MKRPTPADTPTPPYTCRCSLALSLCSAQDVDLQGRHTQSACHPEGTLFFQHKKQFNSEVELWFTSFSPLHFGKVPFASKNLSGGGEQNSLWAGAAPW